MRYCTDFNGHRVQPLTYLSKVTAWNIFWQLLKTDNCQSDICQKWQHGKKLTYVEVTFDKITLLEIFDSCKSDDVRDMNSTKGNLL